MICKREIYRVLPEKVSEFNKFFNEYLISIA
jgi:hypothetical protein